jgi:hypothetical protein
MQNLKMKIVTFIVNIIQFSATINTFLIDEAWQPRELQYLNTANPVKLFIELLAT